MIMLTALFGNLDGLFATTTAWVSSVVGEVGIYIGLAAGVPFAFYAIKKFIGLIPKR